MLVYLSRKRRRALAATLSSLYDDDGFERQRSGALIESAVDWVVDALDYARDDDPDGFVGEALSVAEALEDAVAPLVPRDLRPRYVLSELGRAVRNRRLPGYTCQFVGGPLDGATRWTWERHYWLDGSAKNFDLRRQPDSDHYTIGLADIYPGGCRYTWRQVENVLAG